MSKSSFDKKDANLDLFKDSVDSTSSTSDTSSFVKPVMPEPKGTIYHVVKEIPFVPNKKNGKKEY